MNGLTANEIAKAQNHIDKLAANFAASVHPLFVDNDWKWTVGFGIHSVPTVKDIELTVKCLANSLSDGLGKMHATCSTGRIQLVVLKCDRSLDIRINLTPLWYGDSFPL